MHVRRLETRRIGAADQQAFERPPFQPGVPGDGVVDGGFVYVPDMSPGNTVIVDICDTAVRVVSRPSRPFTPYPVSAYKFEKHPGRWSVKLSAAMGVTSAGPVQVRALSEKDGSPIIIGRFKSSGPVVTTVPDNWVVLHGTLPR